MIVHPLANLTTPYDVLANRYCAVTKSHGTCGLGIGKTMERQINSGHKIYAIDLLNLDLLVEKISQLSMYYPEINSLEHENYFKKYFEAIIKLDWDIQDYTYLKNKDLIFEGSQGVLLDMDHGVYPHVTFTNTTSKNAVEICKKLGHKNIHVYGATRTYHSRHGNGLFPTKPLPLINNEEETCKYNEYQGEFKIGDLDYDLLNQAIEFDKIYSNQLNRQFTLVVTCVDQLDVFNINKVKDNNTFRTLYFNSPINNSPKII